MRRSLDCYNDGMDTRITTQYHEVFFNPCTGRKYNQWNQQNQIPGHENVQINEKEDKRNLDKKLHQDLFIEPEFCFNDKYQGCNGKHDQPNHIEYFFGNSPPIYLGVVLRNFFHRKFLFDVGLTDSAVNHIQDFTQDFGK